MHILKYQHFPNNEIRATHYYKAPPKSVNADERVSGEPPDSGLEPSGSPSVPAEGAPPSNLDISSEVSPKPPPCRRRTTFGLNAKRTLLRAGGALDTVDTKPYHYVMLTGTLPGGTPEAMQAIADESSWVVKMMATWLQKTYPSQYWFYVWELQSRGALHIHWCVHLPDLYDRCCLLWAWQKKWASILDGVAKRTGADVWQRKDGTHHLQGRKVLQADAQTVHSSVAAYLSGYCGGSKDKHSKDTASPYYPSRWWGYSRPLKKLLDTLTETIIVEHSSYRAARNEILLHYEQVLHDTPKAHMYPHKVGIGTTVVSYHPEDRGKSIWQPKKKMLYNRKMHPNTSCTIAMTRISLLEIISLCEALKPHRTAACARWYNSLRDFVLPEPVRGYSIHRAAIQAILETSSESNFVWKEVQCPARLQQTLNVLRDTFQEMLPNCEFDRYGYLANWSDIAPDLTNQFPEWYGRTTGVTPDGSSEGAANGFLSPQTPSFVQLGIL